MARDGSTDRRVEKTRSLLHGAIASLIHEKSYDDIAVKEILGRANVGRSAFYTHYRDKGDLLDTGLRDVVRACTARSPTRSASPAERLLRFSLPLLVHVEQYRRTGEGAVHAERQAVVHARLERAVAESIIDELKRTGRCHQDGRHIVPDDLLASHVAATFVRVLTWWMQRGEPLPATAANDLFRALMLPTLTDLLD